MDIDDLIDDVIAREGEFSNHPADRGGATRWGVTEEVARGHGYTGDMRAFRRADAMRLYRSHYWEGPKFCFVAELAPRIAAEMFDSGVNMGPAIAAKFLQRTLNALNRQARDFPDLVVDGQIGSNTLAALGRFMALRGSRGETVLLKAMEALQGERYISLAENRPTNEAFLYGWLANRIG